MHISTTWQLVFQKKAYSII
uniref:Uncharacterized protein n=1 Tax=Arundo donax TaxID=35708 RepID=A0A0A9A1D2_ARUDO